MSYKSFAVSFDPLLVKDAAFDLLEIFRKLLAFLSSFFLEFCIFRISLLDLKGLWGY